MSLSCKNCREKDEIISRLEKRLEGALKAIERHRARVEACKIPLRPEREKLLQKK